MDWTIERPKSVLALALLDLVRVSFKDLRAPDFKEDLYMQSEVNVGTLFENLDTPAMRKYRQEVLQISNQMLQVKREVTPILADIMHEIINVAETSGWVMNALSLVNFMSYGSSFLNEN
mmetsp:Transcript_20178/g.27271  ORF Transcript_20178/g.27271 Transcript_20178/m.27271 type:complete len:119 (+) Transcript_20178:545-901(+)